MDACSKSLIFIHNVHRTVYNMHATCLFFLEELIAVFHDLHFKDNNLNTSSVKQNNRAEFESHHSFLETHTGTIGTEEVAFG